jgi:hypothetical protein
MLVAAALSMQYYHLKAGGYCSACSRLIYLPLDRATQQCHRGITVASKDMYPGESVTPDRNTRCPSVLPAEQTHGPDLQLGLEEDRRAMGPKSENKKVTTTDHRTPHLTEARAWHVSARSR